MGVGLLGVGAPDTFMSTRALLALLVAAFVPACGGGGGSGGGDVASFRVVAVNPADGSVNVPLDSTVTVTTSEAVDPATVDDQSVRVGRFNGGGEVLGQVDLDPAGGGRVLVFTPGDLLTDETTYAVVVSTRLRSAGGQTLGGRTSFAFRTGLGFDLPEQPDLRAVDSLDVGRRHHAATLLSDGRVLVTGGFTTNGSARVTDVAEIFSPGSENFTTLVARMTQPRAGHTATRLADGRVLIAGGVYEQGSENLNTALTAEVFDPASDTFTAVGDLTSQREDHAALRLPDGRVLVTGGSRRVGDQLEDLDDAEVFSPTTATWSAWPVLMTHPRATHGMVDLGDGRWLLAGGSFDDLRADLFSVATGAFTPVPAPAEDFGRFAAAVERFADGDAVVVGGDGVGSVLHFDRETSRMGNTGSGTDRPRSYATATVVAPDRILVAGGIDFGAGGFVLPTTDLVVQGGVGGSRTYGTSMRFPVGIADHTATRLGDGRVLFCGGLNTVPGASELSGAYVYTP